MARRVPSWVSTTGWVTLAVSAVGLPVALVVALLDAVRRAGSPLAERTTVAGLVLLAVVLVVAVERGVAWAAREGALGWALGGVLLLAGLVLFGVAVPSVGLVLVAVAVVLGIPLALAGTGYLAWWRWQHGPRPGPRTPPTTDEVRAAAEARRASVRARHDRTRAAVEQGLVGPGFTRGS